jgi:putative addiction module killer protein
MIEVREYVDAAGNNPFRKWLDRLDRKALAKVEAAGSRMELGNFGDVEPVGEGVSEHRIHFGPGYRIYFGRDGEHLVILLAGGTKRRQSRDIATAKARWRDYKQRKREKG